jgi:four helix bundle protein
MTTNSVRKGFEDLIVWQSSMDFVAKLYECTRIFPKEELYGLTSQLRRAAISIPSNIAEGSKRGSRKDFRQFILISYGSSAEVMTQIKLARRLGFLNEKKEGELLSHLASIMRMLHKLAAVLTQAKIINH